MTPILQSPKLTTDTESRAKLKTKSKQSRDEIWRLTKLQSPQIHDVTVSRFTDPAPPEKAYIGIKKTPDQSVVLSGVSEQEAAARNEDVLKRTLAGERLADTPDIEEALAKEHRQGAAYERAIEHLSREIDRERTALAIKYSETCKPQHDELMRKLSKQFLDLHAAYSEIYSLKRHLIDNDIGLRGLCMNLPEFLSTPNNPHSEMADFFRAAKREGYIAKIPAEFS